MEFGLQGIAEKEAIAVAMFDALLPSYMERGTWQRDGVVFHVEQVSIVVKATLGNADQQGITLTDVNRAKLIVFARVLPGIPDQGISRRVELRGFISRNEIRKRYKVTKYRGQPGYRVGVKRLRPITDLLWWLQDGGHRHGEDELHAAQPGRAAQEGLPGGGGRAVDAVHEDGQA